MSAIACDADHATAHAGQLLELTRCLSRGEPLGDDLRVWVTSRVALSFEPRERCEVRDKLISAAAARLPLPTIAEIAAVLHELLAGRSLGMVSASVRQLVLAARVLGPTLSVRQIQRILTNS